MPTKSQHMGLPIPTNEDFDGYLDRMKAKWVATRDRKVLVRGIRTLATMMMLAAAESAVTDPKEQ